VSFKLRRATPTDAEEIVDLQIATWRSAFLPLLPAGFEMPPREQFLIMGARSLEEAGVERTVAVTGGRIAGLCTHGPSRDDDVEAEVGEVRALFVHPASWRRGAGKALLSNALAGLRDSGRTEATLWSFARNERANAFYEQQGFERDGASQARQEFAEILEVRYRRSL
jgi:GNAT superfamily N-acetyltransferase